MFEQATIDTRGALKSPWALAVSITGQTAVLSAVVIASLIHADAIKPPEALIRITAPVGHRPDPAPVSQQQRAAVQNVRRIPSVFTAPATIPTKIDMTIQDTPAATVTDFGPGTGIVGAIPMPESFPNIINTIARALPTVRPEPPAQKKAEPPPPPRQIAVSTGVQAAKLITQIKPIYPAPARAARIQGVVRLAAVIGRDGGIENLQVLGGPPFLVAAALDAVKQWRYQPTLLNGEPVSVITQIEVNFTLTQ